MSTLQTPPAPARRRSPASPPAVRLHAVHQSFGDVEAVRGLDLELAQGEVVALLGPNGAGKTSTLDLVLGLARPTSGEVSVLGMEPRQAVVRGAVAAVLQSGGLLDDLTVRETLRYTASLVGATAAAVDAALERAGLTATAGRRVRACSGGEQQRLRFAMALLPDPALLILDEPTTGMDVEARRAFWAAIREDAARGRTVVFATHYLEEADQVADRIVLMGRGRVVADGTSAEVAALTGGRTVRASLPHDGAEVEPLLHHLAAMPDVESVEAHGRAVVVRTTRSDEVARYLLTHTPAHDLEVTGGGLEEAFVALTRRARDEDLHDHETDRGEHR